MIKHSAQGAVDLVGVVGPLNAESGGKLLATYDAKRAAGRPQWVVDLAETPLIDSAGCEALLDLGDRVTEAGGAVCVAGASALVRDVFAATGVGRRFRQFDSANPAIAYFAK